MRGDHEIFAHGEALEDAAALRHQRDAARGDHFRRQPRHRRAEDFDAPPRGGNSPTLTFMQVDLPAPFRPEQTEQPALAELERHLLQHVAVAVIGIDAA